MKRYLALGFVLLACRREQPPQFSPAPDFDVAAERARLNCAAPSPLGRSTRTELCRIYVDFEAGVPFTQIPGSDANPVWFGREQQGLPDQETDADSQGTFMVLYLSAGAPDERVLRTYQLPLSAAVPMVAQDLPLSRFANPTSSVRGVERERADYQRWMGLATALSQGQPVAADAALEFRSMQEDEGSHFPRRGPVAVTRTNGRSLLLRGQLPSARGSTGWYLRMAADGRRAILAERGTAVELWRLP